jgi:DNA-binding HxlR family transcriptional regulator
MPGTRTYGQRCAAAHALDLVGDRWALLVVRDLLLGPKRFTDLRASLPTASPNVLSQRLRDLETTGVIRKSELPPPAASQVYELTDWGRDLEPVIAALGRWGVRSPAMPRHLPMGVDSMAVGLRSLFDPETAAGVRARIQLHVSGQPLRLAVEDGALELERGEQESAQAEVSGSPEAIVGLIWGGKSLDEYGADGPDGVEITGDPEAVEAIRPLFPYPRD